MNYRIEDQPKEKSVEELLSLLDFCLQADNVDQYGFHAPALLAQLKERGVDKESELDPQLVEYVRMREKRVQKMLDDAARMLGNM